MTSTIDPAPAEDRTARTKTVRWHDPSATAELSRGLSGQDFLTQWMRGDVPGAPMGELMGFRLVDVADGEVSFACTPDGSVYNPIGMVHGGLACTVLDSAAGCAVHSTLPAGFGYSSIEIKVSFLRPIQAFDGDIFARGWVVKRGKRVSFAEADLRDANGTVLATASSSCLITPPVRRGGTRGRFAQVERNVHEVLVEAGHGDGRSRLRQGSSSSQR